jgi:xanthine dehydrogenase YagS FAD-binding subunit
MRDFEHINATTVAEATSILSQGDAEIIAGGTVLLNRLKCFILAESPGTIVNIKTIPELSGIEESGGELKIGALTTLSEIAKSTTVQTNYFALAEAALKVGSPELRNAGTIGGNICQPVQCWYYWAEHNAFNCLRKNPASGVCQALLGDNRYHSIFGAIDGCVAVNVSDIAPALIALDAEVVTSKRNIAIENFFAVNGVSSTVLDGDEIITEIQVPTPSAGTKTAFLKFAIRKAIDFPIVNCAVSINGASARICLNGVHNNPYRATAAEDVIAGQEINESNAEAAGEAAIASASALPKNKYMIQIAKTLVKRAILSCA